jgi:membrane protease YdiL (CAAX protease family)
MAGSVSAAPHREPISPTDWRRERRDRRRIVLEIVILLTVTLGMSGWRALLDLLDSLMQTVPLAQQTTTLVSTQSSHPWIDLGVQTANVTTNLAWGCLALYLLYQAGVRMREIGLNWYRPGRDLLLGVLLAACIGIPGLGLYLLAHALGISLNVVPTNLSENWWTVPVLALLAFGNGFVEEVTVVGYLITRMRDARFSLGVAVFASCVLRGSYHLYQGFGGFIGNLIMGFVFVIVWRKTGRLWPLIIAHTLIDAATFIGYPLVAPHVSWL